MTTKGEFHFPDTGQTKCYDQEGAEIRPRPGEALYGQNGCFIIHPMSFTKLGQNGEKLPETAAWKDDWRMVLDNNTGLMWEVKSPFPGDVNYSEDRYSWRDTQDVYVRQLNDQNYGGFDDWRIPNKDELRSIADYGRSDPAIDTWYFPHCKIDSYWCSATYEMQPYFGWVIFFGLGSATAAGKKSLRPVRAVRGGHNELFGKMDLSRFVDSGDGTIIDRATGLMWQKGENVRSTWYEALAACQNMRLAGYDDWRLPNVKELNTILDLTYRDGWWYFRDFFPAEGLVPPLLHYFSSNVHERTYVWVTNFNFGYDGYYADKNAKLLFRAVRNIRLPARPEPEFKLPDTGQILCYDDEGNPIETPEIGEAFYGQDGVYRINPLSFVKLREDAKPLPDDVTWGQGWRMVLDCNTGLIWELKSPHPGDMNYKADRYTWPDAQVYIENLNRRNYGGFGDWRLPNREELRTIVSYNDIIPASDLIYFPDVLPDFYWSKDPYAADPKLIWGIYFAYGCSICYLKETQFLVRAVRGGYNPAFGDTARYAFEDNGDGTIMDLNTGLMWKKDESPEMSLTEALHYCENLNLAGYTDWRLPNIKEIATLVDLSFADFTWFHKKFFPNVITKPLGFYWSSSTFGATFGWGVNFQFGYDGYYAGKKHGRYPFRPVRNPG